MKPVIQKIVAAGIVVKGSKILIIQRANDNSHPGLWEIPSGKREPFEKTINTVVREVKEETDLDVKVGEPIGVFEFKTEKEDEVRDTTQICFLTKLVGRPLVKLSNEHQDFAWITLDQIDDYNISDETKENLRKAFSKL